MLAFFPFRFSLVVIFSIGCLSTLVPEEFLDPRSGEDASQTGEKRKPLVTLDLNLTFMHTPGSVSDLRLGLVHIFTNMQIIMIGSFD